MDSRWAPCGHGSVQMNYFRNEGFKELEWVDRKELCDQWDAFKVDTRPLVWGPINETMAPLCQSIEYERAQRKVAQLFPRLMADVKDEKELERLLNLQLEQAQTHTQYADGSPLFLDAMDVCWQSLQNRGEHIFDDADPCRRIRENDALEEWKAEMTGKLDNAPTVEDLKNLCQSRLVHLKNLKIKLRDFLLSRQIAREETSDEAERRRKMEEQWKQLEQPDGQIVANNLPQSTPHQVVAALRPLTAERLNQLKLLMGAATGGKCSSNHQRWTLQCCRRALGLNAEKYASLQHKLRVWQRQRGMLQS